MSDNTEFSEQPTVVILHDQLAPSTNDQIQKLTSLFKGASPFATIRERETTQEILVEEGLTARLWRAIRGGEDPVRREYIYYKTVATVAGEEEMSGRAVELMGQWVNNRFNELSIVGVDRSWILSLQFNEQGKVIRSSFSENSEEIKELSADELTSKLASLGEFKLDRGFIDRNIDRQVVEDFRAQGGEIAQIHEVPEGADVIELGRLGAGGRRGVESRTYFKVKRPDGEEVIVQASSWGQDPLPGERDVLAVAVGGATGIQATEEKVTT